MGKTSQGIGMVVKEHLYGRRLQSVLVVSPRIVSSDPYELYREALQSVLVVSPRIVSSDSYEMYGERLQSVMVVSTRIVSSNQSYGLHGKTLVVSPRIVSPDQSYGSYWKTLQSVLVNLTERAIAKRKEFQGGKLRRGS